MPRPADSLLILADDLSGAADCAVGAARSGLESVVRWGEQPHAPVEQVIAIDTATRYRPASQAAEIQASLWHHYCPAHKGPGSRLLYKKIDSTLRGNYASEMVALKAAGIAIVAPAFIQAGRTTVDGRVYVHGQALEQTEIWATEGLQGEASIPQMLEAQGLRSASLSITAIRADLKSELSKLVLSGKVDAIVCDAREDADLARIAVASVGLPVYWVGSAGLIAHLPRALGLRGGYAAPSLSIQGSILTVVGSLSSISHQQAAQLAAHATVKVFAIATEVLCAGEAHALWPQLELDIGRALSLGHDVMIRTDAELHPEMLNGSVLTQALGRLLQPWAQTIGALIATGGETAHGMLSLLGVSGLQIVREIETGAPLSVSLGTHRFPVITKAGAFGTPDTLLNCYTELLAIRQNSHTQLS
jgi:uncharacterized protein YgbK (DUF1537 family)